MTIERYYETRMCANCAYFNPDVEIITTKPTGKRIFQEGKCVKDQKEPIGTCLADVCDKWEEGFGYSHIMENTNKVQAQLTRIALCRKVVMDEEEFDSYFAGGK